MDKQLFYLGIDIGSISVKCTLIDCNRQILESVYERSQCRPIEVLRGMLEGYGKMYPDMEISGIYGTGSGKNIVKQYLHAGVENEIICHAAGTKALHPDVNAIIEIGGQDSKLILLDQENKSLAQTAVRDFTMNELCAAGTGAFLDEQACRLGIDIQDFARIALMSDSPSRIAGRCAVFAKTDMIHLQQKGAPLSDILLGLAYSMARNYISNLLRSRQLSPPVSFQGGVASNEAMKKAFCDLLHLDEKEIIVPEYYKTMGSFGAALFALEDSRPYPSHTFQHLIGMLSVPRHIDSPDSINRPPLPLRQKITGNNTSQNDAKVSFYKTDSNVPFSHWVKSTSRGLFLGMDIGSVSEKLVAIDGNGSVLYHDYRYSSGDILGTLKHLLRDFKDSEYGKSGILGAGVTGSGRYLAAKVTGADIVKNEISAQVCGTRRLVPKCDTIIEIGGQDSKFITMNKDGHTDFLMNRVCAAGTGSFLQEQADRLHINIERDFSALALASVRPVSLGNKCTVFMGSDLVYYIQKGYSINDLLAGLSYAVAGNFTDRVAMHRAFGEMICFQGGVASNEAVRIAFEHLLKKRVCVPPYHKVTGAMGVALMTLSAMERHEYVSTRFQLDSVEDIRLKKSFQCNGCTNRCNIQQMQINQSLIHCGGICGRYDSIVYDIGMSSVGGSPSSPQRCRPGTATLELIESLNKLFNNLSISCPEKPEGSIGFPRGLLFYEYFPLWNSFFTRAGFQVIISGPSTRSLIERGMPYVTVETCLPMKVYHGHVLELKDRGCNTIFVPGHVNIPSWETLDTSIIHCPYLQSVPEFIRTAFSTGVVTQTLSNNTDIDGYERNLTSLASELLPKKSFLDMAIKPYIKGVRLTDYFQKAVEDFKKYKEARYTLGRGFLNAYGGNDTIYVIFGKPYSLYDPELNMNLFRKMANIGMEAIPADLIEPTPEPSSEITPNVPWHYNRLMLNIAKLIRNDPRLFPIILTNYGCGPDASSFRYISNVFTNKPLLVLEIDEQTADAGVVTRIEAFHNEVMEYRRSCQHLKDNSGFLKDGPNIISDPPRPKKVYIPHFSEHAHILASALRYNGTDAVVLPPPDGTILEFGRRHSIAGECMPFITLLGDYFHLLESGSFGEKGTAFFMFMAGDCKLGLYGQNTIYEGLKYLPYTLPVIGTFEQLFGENISMLQRMKILDTIYIGMAAIDRILQKLHESRPYEIEKGTADFAFKIARNHICNGIERGETIRGIEYALSVFNGVTVDRAIPKKAVALTGDYYTRINPFANNDLYRRIEELDGIIFVPPTLVDIVPIFMAKNIERYSKRLEYMKLIRYLLVNLELQYQAQKVRSIFEDDILNNFDMTPAEVFEKTSKYLSTTLSSGVISPLGSVIDMIEHGARGIINVITLNCSFGNVLTSVLQRMRKDYGNIPLLTLIYEQQQGGNQMTRLEAFMHQIPAKIYRKAYK
ncbi:MAG: acyl-CoA dehydratase activase [Nitrospirae bacterium YQR-1]